MVDLMINGCVTIFQFLQKHSRVLQHSSNGVDMEDKSFGEEVTVVAAWECCHSKHSAENHWLSGGETGNNMQGVEEVTEDEEVRYMKEMWLMFIPQEEKDKQKLKSILNRLWFHVSAKNPSLYQTDIH